jgi:hypothetical protein
VGRQDHSHSARVKLCMAEYRCACVNGGLCFLAGKESQQAPSHQMVQQLSGLPVMGATDQGRGVAARPGVPVGMGLPCQAPGMRYRCVSLQAW